MMGEEIKRGDLLRDNDPRMPNRVLGVIGFDNKGRAIACRADGSGKVCIALRRIYIDEKPRRTGFSRVDGQP